MSSSCVVRLRTISRSRFAMTKLVWGGLSGRLFFGCGRALMFLLPILLTADPLQDKIQAHIGNFEGKVSFYAKNIDTGATIGIREADPVRTASTIKLPIMAAVFDAVAHGKAKWTEPLTVTAAEKVYGSGIISTEISDGVQLPVRDVMHLMIVL